MLFSSFVLLAIRLGSGNSGALLLEDASRYSAEITAFPHTSSTCCSYCYTLLLHLHPRPVHATSDSDASSAIASYAFQVKPRVEHNYIIISLMYLCTPHPT